MKLDGLVKVRLPHKHGVGSELVWAKPVPNGLFELANNPWLIDGYSIGDVVRATLEGTKDYGTQGVRKIYVAKEVIHKSGWRTIRALFDRHDFSDKRHRPLRTQLRALGASYENMDDRLVSVSFDDKADAKRIAQVLHDAGAHVQYADVPGLPEKAREPGG